MNPGYPCAACQRMFARDAERPEIFELGDDRWLCAGCIAIAAEESERVWLTERLAQIKREEQS